MNVLEKQIVVIKQLVIPFTEDVESSPTQAHLKKLSAVIDVDFRSYKERLQERYEWEIKTARELGFYWFVDWRFAEKFKYRAGLKEPLINERCGFMGWYEESLKFMGDIPDFALDRMETFRVSFKSQPVTIHSMQPLPIKREVILRQIDPVMVGWFHTTYKIYTRWPPKLGVILAIWDKDKEIKALGN